MPSTVDNLTYAALFAIAEALLVMPAALLIRLVARRLLPH